MKTINASVDEKFIEMLKSLDKNKIIKKEESNVFPVIDKPKQYPILGKISAGLPILAVENIEGYTYIPSSKIQKGYDYFFLRVQGDSMNLKFPNGCLLFIQRQTRIGKTDKLEYLELMVMTLLLNVLKEKMVLLY